MANPTTTSTSKEKDLFIQQQINILNSASQIADPGAQNQRLFEIIEDLQSRVLLAYDKQEIMGKTARDKYQRFRNRIQEKKSENDQLQLQIRDLSNRVISLQHSLTQNQELAALQHSQMESFVTQNLSSRVALTAQIEQAQREMQSYSTELIEIKKHYQNELETSVLIMNQLSTEKGSLAGANRSLQEENQRLQTEYLAAQEQIAALSTNNASLTAANSSFSEDAATQEEIALVSSKNEFLEEQNHYLLSRIAELEAQREQEDRVAASFFE